MRRIRPAASTRAEARTLANESDVRIGVDDHVGRELARDGELGELLHEPAADGLPACARNDVRPEPDAATPEPPEARRDDLLRDEQPPEARIRAAEERQIGPVDDDPVSQCRRGEPVDAPASSCAAIAIRPVADRDERDGGRRAGLSRVRHGVHRGTLHHAGTSVALHGLGGGRLDVWNADRFLVLVHGNRPSPSHSMEPRDFGDLPL